MNDRIFHPPLRGTPGQPQSLEVVLLYLYQVGRKASRKLVACQKKVIDKLRVSEFRRDLTAQTVSLQVKAVELGHFTQLGWDLSTEPVF